MAATRNPGQVRTLRRAARQARQALRHAPRFGWTGVAPVAPPVPPVAALRPALEPLADPLGLWSPGPRAQPAQPWGVA